MNITILQSLTSCRIFSFLSLEFSMLWSPLSLICFSMLKLGRNLFFSSPHCVWLVVDFRYQNTSNFTDSRDLLNWDVSFLDWNSCAFCPNLHWKNWGYNKLFSIVCLSVVNVMNRITDDSSQIREDSPLGVKILFTSSLLCNSRYPCRSSFHRNSLEVCTSVSPFFDHDTTQMQEDLFFSSLYRYWSWYW